MTATYTTAAELLAAEGRDLGRGDWIRVERRRRDRFAAATGDTDDVPGLLVLSLAAASLNDLFAVPGAAFAMNYGLDEVRFGGMVPLAARVRLAARIARVAVKPGGAVDVAVDLVIEREDTPTPACTARQLARFQFAEESGSARAE